MWLVLCLPHLYISCQAFKSHIWQSHKWRLAQTICFDQTVLNNNVLEQQKIKYLSKKRYKAYFTFLKTKKVRLDLEIVDVLGIQWSIHHRTVEVMFSTNLCGFYTSLSVMVFFKDAWELDLVDMSFISLPYKTISKSIDICLCFTMGKAKQSHSNFVISAFPWQAFRKGFICHVLSFRSIHAFCIILFSSLCIC